MNDWPNFVGRRRLSRGGAKIYYVMPRLFWPILWLLGKISPRRLYGRRRAGIRKWIVRWMYWLHNYYSRGRSYHWLGSLDKQVTRKNVLLWSILSSLLVLNGYLYSQANISFTLPNFIDLEVVEKLTKIIQSLLTSTAVIVAGVWGYARFIRGRMFSRHTNLTITACIVHTTWVWNHILSIDVLVSNVGNTKISCNKCQLDVYGLTFDGGAIVAICLMTIDDLLTKEWQDTWKLPVYLEPAETISLHADMAIDTEKYSAVRLKAVLADVDSHYWSAISTLSIT